MTRKAVPTPRDPIALLPEAGRRFTIVVESIPDAAWHNPSPCAQWSARDILNHMTAEHLWVPHLLEGKTLVEVGSLFDGDVLAGSALNGDDPSIWRLRWAKALSDSLVAWKDVDRDRFVHSSMGEQPISEYAHQMLVDLTVHAWDLGVATGQEVTLDGSSVATAYAYEKAKQTEAGTPGIFDKPVRIPESAPILHQLLAWLGRDPRNPIKS